MAGAVGNGVSAAGAARPGTVVDVVDVDGGLDGDVDFDFDPPLDPPVVAVVPLLVPAGGGAA
jgi:hypothetical protein